MTTDLIAHFIGGIGLFLLGMRLMSEGLKVAAGHALRRILSDWTRTPFRGFLSGILITSMVQSSSAVTVAVIGFVNAGLLTLMQTIYVIYGTNIGTTMTSWLVALVGFKMDVQAFALPLIGLGMALRLSDRGGRRGALGESVAGFGLFFLGIAILKDAFGEVGAQIDLSLYAGQGASLLLFVGIGFLLTLMMQSSSAAMAVTLTAAAGGVIPFEAAAATVIGANVGTTSTAALSVIGATSNAQRTAAAHVMFNLITACVAIILISPLLDVVELLMQHYSPQAGVATRLAVFHTLFNILGVMLLWFTTPYLVRWLERQLRSADEDLGRPLYLDNNVVTTPSLALGALLMELSRMGELAGGMVRDLLSSERSASSQLHRDCEVMRRLQRAVDEFSVTMQRANLSTEISDDLPVALRISRYFEEVADLSLKIAHRQEGLAYIDDPNLSMVLNQFRGECVGVLSLLAPPDEFDPTGVGQAVQEMEQHYGELKARLLRAGADERLSLQDMVSQLDLHSDLRRAMEQMVKGANRLYEFGDLASRFKAREEGEGGIDSEVDGGT
ncbi:MAG: Na/Pi cotransporter family protein [Chromatiales bacterium]|nr:Na/Pi cotransporter family protein [Chromatiales bacterium]